MQLLAILTSCEKNKIQKYDAYFSEDREYDKFPKVWC